MAIARESTIDLEAAPACAIASRGSSSAAGTASIFEEGQKLNECPGKKLTSRLDRTLTSIQSNPDIFDCSHTSKVLLADQ
ncbi:hypothetical protein A6E15_01110 [Natrinema saccharevitans]|uniref:Uncharacterized protein n=1 Tax=Natrinema saccharevitans TaxID=301967 RepID=A0A1S8ASV6_9EURY|nr:hypothetical protein A6E15_01110 [Natrinema saccharevitans]